MHFLNVYCVGSVEIQIEIYRCCYILAVWIVKSNVLNEGRLCLR